MLLKEYLGEDSSEKNHDAMSLKDQEKEELIEFLSKTNASKKWKQKMSVGKKELLKYILDTCFPHLHMADTGKRSESRTHKDAHTESLLIDGVKQIPYFI